MYSRTTHLLTYNCGLLTPWLHQALVVSSSVVSSATVGVYLLLFALEMHVIVSLSLSLSPLFFWLIRTLSILSLSLSLSHSFIYSFSHSRTHSRTRVKQITEIRVEGIKNYLAPRAALENVCSFVPCSCYSLLFISHHTVQFTNLEHTLRLTSAALGWIYMMYVSSLRCSHPHDMTMVMTMIIFGIIHYVVLHPRDDDGDDHNDDHDHHDGVMISFYFIFSFN